MENHGEMPTIEDDGGLGEHVDKLGDMLADVIEANPRKTWVALLALAAELTAGLSKDLPDFQANAFNAVELLTDFLCQECEAATKIHSEPKLPQ